MISVITVCYNAEKDLETTIQSVCMQKIYNEEIEWIIVDGASKDNTITLVEQYRKAIKQQGIDLQVISEKDKGIYDAMNKGAELANGEWCIYMNAGDVFFRENTLYEVSRLTKEVAADVDFIYGDTIHTYQGKYRLYNAPNEKSLNFTGGTCFCHQSCLMRRSCIIEQPYSLEYKIAGDFDFFVNAFLKGKRFLHVPMIVSIFDKNGISSTTAGIVNYENSKVLYKTKLINKRVYLKRIIKSKLQIELRRIVPKKIIEYRHSIIMKRATANWTDDIKKAL